MGSEDRHRPADLAGVEHWDTVYRTLAASRAGDWAPEHYDDLAFIYGLERALGGRRPTSLLEVGCGDSQWLAYLPRRWGVSRVAGLDYSAEGADRARNRMAAAGVSAAIHCVDLFEASPEVVGRFEVVYSIGLIEHFDHPERVLRALRRFVEPGGLLITEVPNLWRSVHTLLSWIWHPTVLARHRPIGRRRLLEFHRRAGLVDIDAFFVGVLSLIVVSWHVGQRWPGLARRLVPRVDHLRRVTSAPLQRFGFRGSALLSPFLFAVGSEPVRHDSDGSPGAVL